MSCHLCEAKIRRTSTLPPRCYHRKPPPFVCPKYGCPPPEEYPPPPCCSTCPPCPPLICKPRPEPPRPPPTLCIAAPCPEPPGPVPHHCSSPKIPPPASCVRYCLRSTCGQTTYAPCYFSDLPKCPRANTC
ncbi:uncharacterized protein LOC143369589 [Andrena cerasifolii]|uniref:uncharacterized protein LOC143369589 n=1 Tax=Andrena cerasifolii TaxID=2819439 RepID=UPI0040376765